MRIRSTETVTRGPGFDADYTAASIAELEQQRAAGQIEPHAYLIKKQALVLLYLKSTTKPRCLVDSFGSADVTIGNR